MAFENGSIDVAFGRFLTLIEVVLMIVLSGVKRLCRTNLRCDFVSHPRKLVDDFEGDVLFLLVGDPDGGKVL